MITRFFAKKEFKEVAYYLEDFFRALELNIDAVKIRKQAATYAKPYTYRAEFIHQKRHQIISISHSALQQKPEKQQLEIIVPIENKSWLFIDIYPKQIERKKKTLDTVRIPFLDIFEANDIGMDTNNKFFVMDVFDDEMFCQPYLGLNRFGFDQLLVERQKIYLKMPWMPNDYEKTRTLLEVFQTVQELAKRIDAPKKEI